MESKKQKQNPMNKQTEINKQKSINTDDKLIIIRGWGVGKRDKGEKEIQAPVQERISHGNKGHSTGNTIHDTIRTM